MAFTRISSLLILLSLLAIAFAADYSVDSSKYGNDGIPADSPLAKADYESSKPNGEDRKPINYGGKPESEEKPNYGTPKPDIYKSKPEGEAKPAAYENNPYVFKSKPEEEEKPDYDTKKPDSYQPTKPEEDDDEDDDDDDDDDEEKSYPIAVEGFVYCKTGSSHYPITGALAKVICNVEVLGVVKSVPVCSVPTDSNGYFYATVNESNLKLKDCKAVLQTSPLDTCNVPTDVNKGITGFPLSGEYYRVLHDKHAKLYSARPFFFTSDDQAKPAVPNGY